MEKTISLEGRGMIPCPLNEAEAHPYKGPPLTQCGRPLDPPGSRHDAASPALPGHR